MISLKPLQKHFHNYLLIGGFPEIALTDDISFAQKIIREDVVDKVIKRDIVSLFNVRNVNEFEKIFLYLCMNKIYVLACNEQISDFGIRDTKIEKSFDITMAQLLINYINKHPDIKNPENRVTIKK